MTMTEKGREAFWASDRMISKGHMLFVYVCMSQVDVVKDKAWIPADNYSLQMYAI